MIIFSFIALGLENFGLETRFEVSGLSAGSLKRVQTEKRDAWNLYSMGLGWIFWNERNARVFRSPEKKPENNIHDLVSLIDFWKRIWRERGGRKHWAFDIYNSVLSFCPCTLYMNFSIEVFLLGSVKPFPTLGTHILKKKNILQLG